MWICSSEVFIYLYTWLAQSPFDEIIFKKKKKMIELCYISTLKTTNWGQWENIMIALVFETWAMFKKTKTRISTSVCMIWKKELQNHCNLHNMFNYSFKKKKIEHKNLFGTINRLFNPVLTKHFQAKITFHVRQKAKICHPCEIYFTTFRF